MDTRFLGALCFASGLVASDADFNGRWNIEVPNEARRRAWWLEITGGGTGNPAGKFVGAPGGQLDVIPEIAIRDSELRFVFERRYSREAVGKPSRGVYRARLENGFLRGTFEVEGTGARALTWIGRRAPVLKERDDASWREGKPVDLFNGRDLEGWQPMVPNRPLGWVAKDGIMGNAGGANNLVSDRRFWNFRLEAEYRVGADSNGGIGLRGRYEVQILEDHGKPPSKSGNGAVYGRITPRVNASRPPGEWQHLDVRLVGREVTVRLNGATLIERQEIEGLTAMGHDSMEAEPGPISLQGDHGPVEFRRLRVTPLVK